MLYKEFSTDPVLKPSSRPTSCVFPTKKVEKKIERLQKNKKKGQNRKNEINKSHKLGTWYSNNFWQSAFRGELISGRILLSGAPEKSFENTINQVELGNLADFENFSRFLRRNCS